MLLRNQSKQSGQSMQMAKRTVFSAPWYLLALSALLALKSVPAQAATIPAADCREVSVSSAVASAQTGDTVVIPACAQTNWGDNLTPGLGNLTISKCINIQGSGQGVTVLGDNVLKNGTNTSQLINFSVNCPSSIFTLHDLSIIGVATDPNVYSKGHLAISGSGQGFRIYNITGTNMQTSFASVFWVGPGLFDHLTFPNCGGSRGEINMKASGWGGGSYGDGSWADPSPLAGSANQIYIEDNVWNCSGAAPSQATDGDAGARWVVRFNTLTDANGGDHGTDTSQRERSSRWMEVYKNNYTFDSTEAPDFVNWYRGGSGIMWGNAVSAVNGLNSYAKLLNCRDGTLCASGYTPWGLCNGSGAWDQNALPSGYRCVDQPGAGTSNNLGGTNPPPAGWVGNILEPIYVFGNTGTVPHFGPGGQGNVVQDRDFYSDLQYTGGALTASAGVRSGAFANMPGACTTGQGYWATDQGFWNTKTPSVAGGQLYKCTATNTWALWYTPYTYPHPLQGGTPPPPPPPPPTTSPCDVNVDGFTNVADVQMEVNMALQLIACPPSNSCSVVGVQRVVNAALGGTCVTP